MQRKAVLVNRSTANVGGRSDRHPVHGRVCDEGDSRGKSLWRQRLMAQTCACGRDAACARGVERQRGRVLKNECFSGVLKPPWRFSSPTR